MITQITEQSLGFDQASGANIPAAAAGSGWKKAVQDWIKLQLNEQEAHSSGFAIGVTVLCLIGWAVATHPPSPPTQSLAFATAFQSRKGTDWRKYMVTVSNTTAYTVEYGKGFNKLWFEIAYASNGVWMTTNVTTPGVESCFLLPHAVLTDSIFVPEIRSLQDWLTHHQSYLAGTVCR